MPKKPSAGEADHLTDQALDRLIAEQAERRGDRTPERWTDLAVEQPSAGVAECRDIKRWTDRRKRIGALGTPSIGEAELRSGRLPRHQTLDGRAQEHLSAGQAER